jgi:hypothetical protein
VLLYKMARDQWFVDLQGDYTVSAYMWADLHGNNFTTKLFSGTFVEVDGV